MSSICFWNASPRKTNERFREKKGKKKEKEIKNEEDYPETVAAVKAWRRQIVIAREYHVITVLVLII